MNTASTTIPVARARLDARPGQPDTWRGLHGSALALALLEAAAHSDRPVLFIARSSHRARALEQDLELLNRQKVPIWHFPDRETLPYDPFSAHPDIVSERLAALSAVAGMKRGLLLAPAPTLSERLPPRSHVLGQTLELIPGQTLSIDDFREQLLQAGYESVEQVYQSGQFAVRGALLDLFPTGCAEPIRIDLFDEDIESLRTFDPDSQRSTGELAELRLLPAREYPADKADLNALRRALRLRFDGDMRQVPIYQDLRAGNHPQGLEQYLPLFFETTESLYDYLSSKPKVIMQDGAAEAVAAFAAQTADRYEQRRHDPTRPILAPEELFFDVASTLEPLQRQQVARLPDDSPDPYATLQFATLPAPELPIHEAGKETAQRLRDFEQAWDGRILFAADTAGRREALGDTLRTFGLRPERFDSYADFSASDERLGLAIMPLEAGFAIAGELAVLTESQLFGARARRTTESRREDRDPEAIIRNLADLELGAPVVHEDHGVGRYQGLQTLEIDQREAEFLTLEYADGDRLYVPVAALHLVSRYTGASAETAPLHRLGGEQWTKARRKAAEKVRDVAAELLDLYARRQARKGFAFELEDRLYEAFAATFPFEETRDQHNAIEAVRGDMISALPMDRVVCGDVGFGKTEVALRAAFIAVQGGKQVAFLAPTTLLAQQHYETFADRFADWPVRLDILSRFISAKSTEAALTRIREGTTDIVIGTHRLIQKDVRFKHLGLVMVDEEQRFGVRQKERLKQLRAEVDMLTLTATPIPRTLNMAMSGIRDLSIIATPPARRMAVKTMVSQWDNGLLREALQREIQRGGQVFFVHNEVRSIERIAREVGELIPEARIRVAHGQMPERELEQVMLDFHRQRFHVIVCTTIIENGIDIPTANTIIINRADRFGLSQLHQLRGRVGRSHHLAYAYLLTPEPKAMTKDAQKRLEAIASLKELGAGFTLATHDMEIRGAGELLGEDQSGQIAQIGFSLYSELLSRAVEALREGREPDLEESRRHGAEVELHLAALIPDDYLHDVHTRLTLYKRIASARDEDALRELQVEMIDRFGLLPDPARALFAIARLKLKANAIGVSRVDVSSRGGRFEFEEHAAVDVDALLALVHQNPRSYKLAGPQKLQLLDTIDGPEERIERVEGILDSLTAGSG